MRPLDQFPKPCVGGSSPPGGARNLIGINPDTGAVKREQAASAIFAAADDDLALIRPRVRSAVYVSPTVAAD